MAPPPGGMDQSTLATLFEKILIGCEKCHRIIELQKIMTNDKGIQVRSVHYYALVVDKATETQFAVLTLVPNTKRFGKKNNPLIVTETYPIYSDFRVRNRTDTQFDLMFGTGHILTLEHADVATVKSVVAELEEALRIAREKGYEKGAATHLWLMDYTDRKRKSSKLFTPESAGGGSSGAAPPQPPKSPVPGASAEPTEDGTALAPPAVERVKAVSRASTSSNNGSTNSSTDGYDSETNEVDPVVFGSMAMKDEWVDARLKDFELEYTDVQNLTVFIGTWNVNAKPPADDLSAWLGVDYLEDNKQPDIYAIGFQEIDNSTQAVITNDASKGKFWEEKIETTLTRCSNTKYIKVASKQLVGILVCVYAKQQHAPHISNLDTCSVGVGIMGVMGNKGGATVRFSFRDTSMCFVCSHLAAHMDAVKKRNQDHLEITRRTVFQGSGAPEDNTYPVRKELLPEGGNQYGMYDHDHLFWFGDLNYRLPLTHEEIKKRIDVEDWEYLQDYDQLLLTRKGGYAFVGYEEAPINFTPTYKYDPGTDRFDTSVKSRPPAWCDRVLWKSRRRCTNLHYGRHELNTSDHKPVSALFEMETRQLLPDKKAQKRLEIVRELDKLENSYIPDITLETNAIDVGELGYGETVSKQITITNVSNVNVSFSFVRNPSEPMPPWLSTSPRHGTVPVGGTAALTLTLSMKYSAVYELNKDPPKIDALLILHVEGGRDFFINVTGTYRKSCFGHSLSQLVRIPGPVRTTGPQPSHPAVPMRIPKELWRMVDHIFVNGVGEEDLFINTKGADDSNLIGEIREALDTGEEFADDTSAHVMSAALVEFLGALADPVIPFHLYQLFVDAKNDPERIRQLISQLPSAHYNSFVYLASFLREVLKQGAKEKKKHALYRDKLAFLFGSVMLRPPPENNEKEHETTTFLAPYLDTEDAMPVGPS